MCVWKIWDAFPKHLKSRQKEAAQSRKFLQTIKQRFQLTRIFSFRNCDRKKQTYRPSFADKSIIGNRLTNYVVADKKREYIHGVRAHTRTNARVCVRVSIMYYSLENYRHSDRSSAQNFLRNRAVVYFGDQLGRVTRATDCLSSFILLSITPIDGSSVKASKMQKR